MSERSALWSTEELDRRLRDPDLRIVDGSFHLPAAQRHPRSEYLSRHIPGALFFDIEAVVDPSAGLPHMLPTAERFAEDVSALGIGNAHTVVVYDAPGSAAAARIWWTFRVFGHHRVVVLDGGLAKWLAEGRPIEEGKTLTRPASFVARLDGGRVRSSHDLIANLASGGERVVDARSAGRYRGLEPEPRPTLRRGHIPGAGNLPFLDFFDGDRNGVWRTAREIADRFAAAGVDPGAGFVSYCGSGITACVPVFAAFLLGHDRGAVYDGSWAEWGNRNDVPVAQG